MGARFSAASNESLNIPIGHVNTVKCEPLNKVVTTKYTLLTFIPLNIFEQFRRAVYIYFLLITILSFFVTTTSSPLTSLIPLLIVMAMTALKEGREDFMRYKNDKAVNTAEGKDSNGLLYGVMGVTVLRDGKECQIACEFLNPGDLVVLNRDCDVPCDLILLSSTDVRGKCYVNTINLDGESNLKTLYIPSGMPNSSDVCLENFGDIVCEQPNPDLYSFNGRIEVHEMHGSNVLPLTVQNLLQRGTTIKNTERVVGCAIYTGMMTKLQLNSRQKGSKKASSDQYINKFILALIGGMIVCILVLFIIERVEIGRVIDDPYIGSVHINGGLQIFEEFIAFLILFNYMIPLSMYVNIEIYRIYGKLFMIGDINLYDEATDQPCIVNTSILNEDLGQINIIFSDKTGTLTKNEMKFVECSINAIQYQFCDKHLNNVSTQAMVLPDNFDIDQTVFFEALSLCHAAEVVVKPDASLETSAQTEKFDTELPSNCYQASSPDEQALLEACASVGIIFEGFIDDDVMCVRYVLGSSTSNNTSQSVFKNYKRLCLLEFSSERKRMSVIVRDENGTIWLYCKGAESSIFPLCSDKCLSRIAKTDEQITEFAKKGLRTLAIGRRMLTEKEYECFLTMYNAANSALENRQQLIDESYAKVEKELELLGATAIEDALQDNVTQTLADLQAAGIKIWVLTGDKVETAVNIGMACKHIPANAKIHYITNTKDSEEILRQLKEIEEFCTNRTENENALVVDGESLTTILTDASDQFLNAALMCKSVICCRLSPLQKSEVVTIIKKTRKYLTAAVGDGANDVSMLQEAHVGIAIIGREGLQATRSADYAIAKFDMLRRLLLVHGHYNSTRLAFLVLFFCYKNVLVTGCMALYQFYDLYSATTIFTSLYLWLFETIYTGFIVTFTALSDQPYDDVTLLKYPILYKNNTHNNQASWWKFAISVLNAFLHMFIIFYFAYFAIGINDVFLNSGHTADFYLFGLMMGQVIVIVANLKIFLLARYITLINRGFVVMGIFAFMLSQFIVNMEKSNDLYWVYNMFVSSLPMWLYTFVTAAACLLIDLIVKVVHKMFFYRDPTSCDRQTQDQFYRSIPFLL